MSKSLIYLIAIFCLWMYFTFSGNSQSSTMAEKYTVEDFDKAQSGSGGTMVSTQGAGRGDIVSPLGNAQGAGKGSISSPFGNRGTFTAGGGFGSTNVKVASGVRGGSNNKGRTDLRY